jgi:hypothetical protein
MRAILVALHWPSTVKGKTWDQVAFVPSSFPLEEFVSCRSILFIRLTQDTML